MVLYVKNGVKQFDHRLLCYLAKGKNVEALAMLKNVDPRNLFDVTGKSLLHWTIRNCKVEGGNASMVQYFIDSGCNVNTPDKDGDTPLLMAVEADQMDVVKALINANASIFISNIIGFSPIKHVFSMWSLPDRDVVKLFLNKLKSQCGKDKQLLVNKLMEFKCPIYFAVLLRDADITRMMLDRGCSVTARCHVKDDTALHEAVAQSDLANVKLLIERGADINDEGDEEETSLQRYDISAEDTEEKLEVLKFLIVHGASLNVTNEDRVTLMETFMREGSKETVCALLQTNAIDLRMRNAKGESALHLVCSNKNPGVEEAIRLFRGKNFDVNAVDSDWSTALMIAATSGMKKTVEHLLEIGADPNFAHEDWTPLYVIYKEMMNWNRKPVGNFRQIVDLLLLHGAEFQNSRYDTYLNRLDVKADDPYLAESLLARLAEMELQDRYAVIKATRYNIDEVESYRKYFEFCHKSLAEMKLIKVHQSVTLFDLLKGIGEKKLLRYVRNEEFLTAYKRISTDKFNSIPHYYSSIIQWRVTTAKGIAKLEQRATAFICKIMNLNRGHIIAQEIIDYLDNLDIKNLSEVI